MLVQLGDILDRGEDEIAILSLLRSLDIQAKENGGAVFQVRHCFNFGLDLHFCQNYHLLALLIGSCAFDTAIGASNPYCHARSCAHH